MTKKLLLYFMIFLSNTLYGEDIFSTNFIIAHATGGYKDTKYLNSVESFENSYKNGLRLFEIDFWNTTDGYVVGFHVNRNTLMNVPDPFSYSDWTNYTKYPSPFNVQRLDIPLLITLLKKYLDTYLVTDHKNTNSVILGIIEAFQKNDISLERPFLNYIHLKI